MQGNDDEKVGFLGLTLGFALAYILVLVLGETGFLSYFNHFVANSIVLFIFTSFMLIFCFIPRKWFLRKKS